MDSNPYTCAIAGILRYECALQHLFKFSKYRWHQTWERAAHPITVPDRIPETLWHARHRLVGMAKLARLNCADARSTFYHFPRIIKQVPPRVSVLMSVYNGEKYLAESVESILSQTFRDFEFIVIDDGSTDRSGWLLDEFARKDSRIRVIHQENCGLTMSLNSGLALARGCYVARMDADDISESARLQKQLQFLQSNADHVAVGTSGQIIDEMGNVVSLRALGGDDREIAVQFLADNYLIHGSVLFRNVVGIRYSGELRYAQDYELWVRLRRVGKLANLPDVLYCWRRHSRGITATRLHEQKESGRKIADEHLQFLLQQGRHDVVFEAYARGIGSATRAKELRESLKSLTWQKGPRRRPYPAVRVGNDWSARLLLTDFRLCVQIGGFRNAAQMLLRIAYLRSRYRIRERISKP